MDKQERAIKALTQKRDRLAEQCALTWTREMKKLHEQLNLHPRSPYTAEDAITLLSREQRPIFRADRQMQEELVRTIRLLEAAGRGEDVVLLKLTWDDSVVPVKLVEFAV